jgi:hypothetical protein
MAEWKHDSINQYQTYAQGSPGFHSAAAQPARQEAPNFWLEPVPGEEPIQHEVAPFQTAPSPAAIRELERIQTTHPEYGLHWDRDFGWQCWIRPPKPIPQEIDEDNSMPKLVNSFKIGADPEFIVLNPNGSLFLTGVPQAGPIGHDHHGRVLELRPGPSRLASRLLKNMWTLLHSPQLQKFSDKRWRAGGMAKHASQSEPLGGHIHLDIPYNPRWIESSQAGSVNRAKLDAAGKVIQACDNLTRCFESLEILHSRESNARRHQASGYGRLGDVRECQGHLEYRTPISWLYSPSVAYWVLTGYKLAAARPDSLGSLQPANGSWSELRDWYQRFTSDDLDARRALEKLAVRGLAAVQGDPEANIQDTWRELPI